EADYGPPPDTKVHTGDASYYPPTGNPTADGEKYDGTGLTGAMQSDKVPKLPHDVYVHYDDGKGRACTLKVKVNDRGPWAVDEKGKLIHPLAPHPTRIIDLSPDAFRRLVGTTRPGIVPVVVIVP